MTRQVSSDSETMIMTHYASLRQLTIAHDSLRQLTTHYVSLRQLATAHDSLQQLTTAYASLRQHTTVYDSLRQLTTAHDSLRQLTAVYDSSQQLRQPTPIYDSSRQLMTDDDSLPQIMTEQTILATSYDGSRQPTTAHHSLRQRACCIFAVWCQYNILPVVHAVLHVPLHPHMKVNRLNCQTALINN